MKNYLGEFPVDISTTPYAAFGPAEWALHYIYCYGQIDGSHHKQWVLDQVARILNGTPVIVTEARWEPNAAHPNGHSEYRIIVSEEPTEAYTVWVDECCEDGYSYDIGIAP